MTANEIMNDVQCNITYMTDNAQGVVKALYELAQCDDLIGTANMDGDYESKSKVHELLRTHDTCARLVCVLSDTLDGIMKELDRLDDLEIQTGTPGTTPAKGCEKRNGEQP